MFQARTHPLLECRNQPLSQRLGRCHQASPERLLDGANWALASVFVSLAVIAPIMVATPTRTTFSISYFTQRYFSQSAVYHVFSWKNLLNTANEKVFRSRRLGILFKSTALSLGERPKLTRGRSVTGKTSKLKRH